jgi:hypothetical protein
MVITVIYHAMSLTVLYMCLMEKCYRSLNDLKSLLYQGNIQ